MFRDLRLLVTELVANSFYHSSVQGKVRIAIKASDRASVTGEVCDPGHGLDLSAVWPRRGNDAGFGLQILDGLADRWGVTTNGTTTVWFEIDRGDRS